MTTYTSHPDALFDPNKPILGSVGLQGRDNLVATTEGNGPQIQDAALATGAATSAGETWVGKRMAGISAGARGQLGFFRDQSGISRSFGTTVSGSNLRAASASGVTSVSGLVSPYTPSGTWRCLGIIAGTGGAEGQTSLFVRIS